MRRAFVIQLLDQCNQAGFAGRVEHVDSGRDRRFRSPEELLRFIEEMLIEAEQAETEGDEAQSHAASDVTAGRGAALDGNT